MVEQDDKKSEWRRKTILAKLWIREHQESGTRYLSGYCNHWLLARGVKLLILKVREDSKLYERSKNPPDYIAMLLKPQWDPDDVFNPTRHDYYDPEVVRERMAILDMMRTKNHVAKEGFDFIHNIDREDPAMSQALMDMGARLMADVVEEDPRTPENEPQAD